MVEVIESRKLEHTSAGGSGLASGFETFDSKASSEFAKFFKGATDGDDDVSDGKSHGDGDEDDGANGGHSDGKGEADGPDKPHFPGSLKTPLGGTSHGGRAGGRREIRTTLKRIRFHSLP
jgi:hypothetical protein